MNKLAFFLVLLILLIALAGCRAENQEDAYDNHMQSVGGSIELLGAARHYGVESFELDLDIDFSQFRIFLHNEELHLLLLEVDAGTLISYIRLLRIDADGSNVRELYHTQLDESVDFFNIIGFEKHSDGYISLVTTDNMVEPPYTREDAFSGLWHFDISYSYTIRRISPDGRIMSALSIEALNTDERQVSVSDIAFDSDGNAVAAVSWFPPDMPAAIGVVAEGAGGQSFLLFDNGITEDFHEVVNETFSSGIFDLTNDGQIFAPSFSWAAMTDLIMFYEVDFENTAIVNGPVIDAESPLNSINGVFPAPQTSMFDFYIIGNDSEFFGYSASHGVLTLLINFWELGVPLNQGAIDRNHFLLWEDGRMAVVNLTWNASLRRDDITLFLLTPSDEPSDYDAEPEIITIAMFDAAGSPLMQQVAMFNRQNDTHQIEVVDYSREEVVRLRTELIARSGPDIFMLSWGGQDLIAALSEGDFMLDLYQMIDADPELSRDDFFPSVLSAWENSRGELIKIASDFAVQTIIGMQPVFPEVPESWNYADFIAFYNEAREAGYIYPLGEEQGRMDILRLILFRDDTFFSERDGTANFDSESFIDVLNFLMTIPEDQGWDRISHLAMEGLWDPHGGLIRGEQLLSPMGNISNIMDFRALQLRLGGIAAFGFPSDDAPSHAVQVPLGTAVGIRSNSPHIDAAWEFVRLGLLPSAPHNGFVLPLRIDLFEELVYDEINSTLEHGMTGIFGELELPQMTESDADVLRNIVSNIGHSPMFGHPVQDIVSEDVSAFFAGLRTAEDTARIIQSRVSIFLAERER
jgi:hypothetical protein